MSPLIPKKNFLKKFINQIHLWLGLLSGLVFFIIALSGAIYTWEPEIGQIIYKQQVEPEDKAFISISQLKKSLKEAFPQGDFRAAQFQGKNKAVEVLAYVPGTYYHAFMNPYTGELIHLQDMKKGWLNGIIDLHRNLMLGPIGRKIVHWVTLFSLLLLITGLVLWWPVNKQGRKQRFRIKWKASPKRLNYDLHNVLGFYATWIAIFTVLTGIFWGFEVIPNMIKTLVSEDSQVYDIPISVMPKAPTGQEHIALIDSLSFTFNTEYPEKLVRVNYPHSETEALHFVLIHPNHLVYNTEHHYFDRYTGRGINGNFASNSKGFKVVDGLVYDIHIGNIGGWFGRLIVSLASLIVASLPITGFIIWWGKRKQKN